MNSIAIRVCLAAGVMLVGQYFASQLQRGYQFEVVAPAGRLSDIPIQIGEWSGIDAAIDPRTEVVLNAHDHMNRTYTNGLGNRVLLHAAVWVRPEEVGQAAPHHPQVCYTGAGWEIVERRVVTVQSERGSVPIELMLMQRAGDSIVTGHWYRMGDDCFTSASEARKVFQRLWGQAEWPPTIKTLLQVPAETLESGSDIVCEFAASLNSSSPEPVNRVVALTAN